MVATGVVWYRYQQTYQIHTSAGALYVSVCLFLAKETWVIILELLRGPIFFLSLQCATLFENFTLLPRHFGYM